MEEYLSSLKVVDLKNILREKGAKISGVKSELIKRILNLNTSPVYLSVPKIPLPDSPPIFTPIKSPLIASMIFMTVQSSLYTPLSFSSDDYPIQGGIRVIYVGNLDVDNPNIGSSPKGILKIKSLVDIRWKDFIDIINKYSLELKDFQFRGRYEDGLVFTHI